ncbi:NIPSNAP family protein [Devosia ginsengisoli]|uniref:NIPSNAP family protein n=1 Tax=Devosia ginsengisoli TaxID=400770 RepID=A0A5B8LXT3_9HYPH|nr:NIPSNAP family protein [Devosia ginsengisoli]QDZ13328.1 NIPSNAP family protein [Devosia ginsengisoli]
MIVEERDYRIKVGKLTEFLSHYERDGLPVQEEHLGKILGHFVSEIGELNHIVTLWGYASLDDRLARRDAMAKDPRWQAYLSATVDLVDIQTTRLLRPTSISPIR